MASMFKPTLPYETQWQILAFIYGPILYGRLFSVSKPENETSEYEKLAVLLSQVFQTQNGELRWCFWHSQEAARAQRCHRCNAQLHSKGTNPGSAGTTEVHRFLYFSDWNSWQLQMNVLKDAVIGGGNVFSCHWHKIYKVLLNKDWRRLWGL